MLTTAIHRDPGTGPMTTRTAIFGTGITHAVDGDTVYVFNGLYNENVIVNKSIYFRGEQQDNTIIDGGNNGTVVQLTAETCL